MDAKDFPSNEALRSELRDAIAVLKDLRKNLLPDELHTSQEAEQVDLKSAWLEEFKLLKSQLEASARQVVEERAALKSQLEASVLQLRSKSSLRNDIDHLRIQLQASLQQADDRRTSLEESKRTIRQELEGVVT